MKVTDVTDDALSRLKQNEHALKNALLDAGARKAEDDGHWSCPFHGKDRHGSLSVFSRNDKWAFFCHACNCGGSIVDVLVHSEDLDAKAAVKAALERYGEVATSTTVPVDEAEAFDLPDLADISSSGAADVMGESLDLPDDDLPDMSSIPTAEPAHTRPGFATIDDVIGFLERKQDARCTRRDLYCDKTGQPVMTMLRLDKNVGTGKSYRPVRHQPDGSYALGDPPGLLPLFNIVAIYNNPTEEVVVVEGEKAAMALIELGFIATTSAHGAKSSSKSDWAPLAGRTVIVWPDNDQPGIEYGNSVSQILNNLTPSARVKIVDPTKLGIREGGDVVDLLEVSQ